MVTPTSSMSGSKRCGTRGVLGHFKVGNYRNRILSQSYSYSGIGRAGQSVLGDNERENLQAQHPGPVSPAALN
jgi:hypothetical protein